MSKFIKLTDLQKLRLSVYFGWVIVGLTMVISPIITAINGGDYQSDLFIGILFTGFILSIRYSMLRPVLRAAGGGAKVVGIAFILEYFFSRKASGAVMGAFIGTMLVLIFLLLKNAAISIVLLSKETLTLIKLGNDKENFSIFDEVAVSKEL
jgi:hypothetical protein